MAHEEIYAVGDKVLFRHTLEDPFDKEGVIEKVLVDSGHSLYRVKIKNARGDTFTVWAPSAFVKKVEE